MRQAAVGQGGRELELGDIGAKLGGGELSPVLEVWLVESAWIAQGAEAREKPAIPS